MDIFNKVSGQRSVSPLSRSLIGLLLLLTLACGKEAKNNGGNKPSSQIDPITSELEDQIKRQTVDCDNGLSCPEYVAKIVIVDRARLRTCTGFLLNSLVVGTSASCLTEKLRASYTNERLCQTEVHIFFGRSNFRPAKRVHCARLLLVSQLTDDDPVLWRNDIAYIELAEPVFRSAMRRMSREGIADNSDVTMWKVDEENDQVGIIRKSECKSVVNSYVNPLSTTPYDPAYLISNCTLKKGNKGAIILNDKGNWQGVFSGNLDSAMMNFMNTSGYLVERLMSIGHVSNTVCLPALRDDNPVVREECLRDLDYTQLDRRRGEMLSAPSSHAVAIANIEKTVSDMKPYINWKVELVQDGDRPGNFRVRLKPKCLKPVNDWIRRFSNPPSSFRFTLTIRDSRLSIGLDRAGRIVSKIDDSRTKNVEVTFSPSNARSSRSSSVRVASGTEVRNYNSVTETCE